MTLVDGKIIAFISNGIGKKGNWTTWEGGDLGDMLGNSPKVF